MIRILLVLIISLFMTDTPNFKEQQLKFDRVKSAYDEKENTVKELLATQEVTSGYKIFLRAFKKEKELEVWIKTNDTYALLTKYDFCTSSGVLGPKRKEGDLQIPEGVYF